MQFYICSVLDGCSILDTRCWNFSGSAVRSLPQFIVRLQIQIRTSVYPPSTQSWDILPTLLLGPSVNNEKKKKKEKDAVIPV